jgi:glycosyltransferase involved in cell wall biosynthesis
LKENPLISICIPSYNASPFIEEAISSWINQTYRNVEIIIQDDCSNDGTFGIALRLSKSDDRVKVFKNLENYGIGKNWNECYNKAKGEYVVIFNADDTVKPNFIEDSLKILYADTELDMVIHNYVRSTELDCVEEISIKAKLFHGKTYDIINVKNQLYKRIHWNFTLSKKQSIDKLKNEYGLFYPTQVCDGMLWFEAYKQRLFAYYCSTPIGVYRDHEFNNSKIKFGEFESTFIWMLPIYSDIFSLKHPGTFTSAIKTITGYLFKCIKALHKPKYMVIINLLKYGS